MKRHIKKPVVISALIALGLAGGAVGTTFALFTDRADTKIEVTAGIVDLDYEITLVKYENEEGLLNHDYDFENDTEYVTETNTEFKISGTNVTVSRMIPGDKLTLKIAVKNKSNVKTKWRFVTSKIGELAPALTVSGYAENDLKWQALDAADPEHPETIFEKELVIAFPNHDEGILAREEGIDNFYQGKEAVIKFAAEMVQGNASVKDYTVIEEVPASYGHDGYTYVLNTVTNKYEYRTKPSQLDTAKWGQANTANFLYAEEAGEKIVDAEGFLVKRNASEWNNSLATLRAAIPAGTKYVMLPPGEFAPDTTKNAESYSCEDFRFNGEDVAFYGDAIFNANGFVEEFLTTLDTYGHRYHSGLTYNEMAVLNGAKVGFTGVAFKSTHENQYDDDINTCHSKTFLFAQNATASFYNCYFDMEDFQRNAISRSVFDLRAGGKIHLSNSNIKAYTNGFAYPGVGICSQNLVSVNANYNENPTNNPSFFRMSGGSIVNPTTAQTKVYTFGAQQIALQDVLDANPTAKSKIVSFYLSDMFPADADHVIGTKVEFDGEVLFNEAQMKTLNEKSICVYGASYDAYINSLVDITL